MALSGQTTRILNHHQPSASISIFKLIGPTHPNQFEPSGSSNKTFQRSINPLESTNPSILRLHSLKSQFQFKKSPTVLGTAIIIIESESAARHNNPRSISASHFGQNSASLVNWKKANWCGIGFHRPTRIKWWRLTHPSALIKLYRTYATNSETFYHRCQVNTVG